MGDGVQKWTGHPLMLHTSCRQTFFNAPSVRRPTIRNIKYFIQTCTCKFGREIMPVSLTSARVYTFILLIICTCLVTLQLANATYTATSCCTEIFVSLCIPQYFPLSALFTQLLSVILFLSCHIKWEKHHKLQWLATLSDLL